MSLDDDAVRQLAAAVLKLAVEEADVMPELEFWCDVLGLEPSLFFEKARIAVLRKKDKQAHHQHEQP